MTSSDAQRIVRLGNDLFTLIYIGVKMALGSGLGKTLGILDSAADVLLNTAERSLNSGKSVMSIARQTTILSRVFIDESVLGEIIIPNVMRSLHEYYAAQIIAALHLSQMVDGFRTVQDVMTVVQDGSTMRNTSFTKKVMQRRMGMESFLSNYLGEAGLESSSPFTLVTKGDISKIEKERDDAQKELDTLKGRENNVSVRSVSSSDNRIGPMGELYEVKLTNPNNSGVSVVIPLFIQMQPSLAPADIAPRFIDMNVSQTLWQRWTQMRAGELSFFKDFLFQRDAIKRHKAILKDPKKAEAFSEFLKTVAKKDAYSLMEISDRSGSAQSSNLANSVMIFSEDTVLQAKVQSGIDLHNPHDRARYFKQTYTMIIVVVDPLHQRITIYFNGIDGEVDASYTDFKPKDAKFDPNEFMAALQAFSTNNIGRLR